MREVGCREMCRSVLGGFREGRGGESCRAPWSIMHAKLGVTFSSLCVLCSVPHSLICFGIGTDPSLAQGVCQW